MSKRRFIWVFTLLLAACAAPATSEPIQPLGKQPAKPPAVASDYPDLGSAPELVGDVWLNVDAPLQLADLQGKVTLIDMWTFG